MDEVPPAVMDEILGLIYDGQKIQAVKRYRDVSKTSLLEAKQFIEKLTDELKEREPEKFTNLPKTGCAGALLLVAILLSSAIAGLLMAFIVD